MKIKLNIEHPIRVAGKHEFSNLEDFYKFLIKSKIRGIKPNNLLYALTKDGHVGILTREKNIQIKFDKPNYNKTKLAAEKSNILKPSGSGLEFIKIFEGKN